MDSLFSTAQPLLYFTKGDTAYQGRTQGGVGVNPPLSLIFYKNLLPAQRRLIAFAILSAC